MTTKRAAEILAEHNDWRTNRGKWSDENCRDPLPKPSAITVAIDTAVRALTRKTKRRKV